MTDEIIKCIRENNNKKLNEIVKKLTLYWMYSNAGRLYTFNESKCLTNDFKVYYFNAEDTFENIEKNKLDKNIYAYFYVNYRFYTEHCSFYNHCRNDKRIKYYVNKFSIGNLKTFMLRLYEGTYKSYHHGKKYIKNNNAYVGLHFNRIDNFKKMRLNKKPDYFFDYYTFYHALKIKYSLQMIHKRYILLFILKSV